MTTVVQSSNNNIKKNVNRIRHWWSPSPTPTPTPTTPPTVDNLVATPSPPILFASASGGSNSSSSSCTPLIPRLGGNISNCASRRGSSDVNMAVLCSICLNILRNPVVLPCNGNGHAFCRLCIERWLDENRTCPSCRQEVPANYNPATPTTLPQQVSHRETSWEMVNPFFFVVL